MSCLGQRHSWKACTEIFSSDLLSSELDLSCISMGFLEAERERKRWELFLLGVIYLGLMWGKWNIKSGDVNSIFFCPIFFLASAEWFTWDQAGAKSMGRCIWIKFSLKGSMVLSVPLFAMDAKCITSGLGWMKPGSPEFPWNSSRTLQLLPAFYRQTTFFGRPRGRKWLWAKPISFLICQKIREKNGVVHVCW